ncbi:unnamed protein product [Closterium sp. NIES-54]
MFAQRVPLSSPPASSLAEGPDPESDLARAASPTIPRLQANIVTEPSFESATASALVAELVDFAAACRLDYAASLVAESESDCPPSVGDPDAPDIPSPRSYAEAITGPYSSHWQTAMDAKMASWKSTGTYVDAIPPPGANIVDGMWIFRVKRPPGSPPAFKARYVARGFTQRDYELHSLDFSIAFLQGSLHEEILLHHPPGFTGLSPAGAQWILRRPVYVLRQAPREWHDTIRTTLAALGFAPSTTDPSLFLCTDTSLPPFYVIVYINDLVFATADTEALALVKSELQKRHSCTDLGERDVRPRRRRRELQRANLLPVLLLLVLLRLLVDECQLGVGIDRDRRLRDSTALLLIDEAPAQLVGVALLVKPQLSRWPVMHDLQPESTAAPIMASPTLLTFDAEGRAVAFDVWLDDLQLFLQCDSKDGLSLFDLTSGASTAPAADADSTVRSQWLTRDAAARLAVRSHLPSTKRVHFSQYKSAKTLYDAVVARYSSPATAALSRLMLPYLFPDLAAFATVTDLIMHLHTSDTRYRAALPAEFYAQNPPPMYITLYYLVTRLPDTLRSQLREWYAGRQGSGGAGPCTYVLRTGDRTGEQCGGLHATQRCFCRLTDAWCAQFPDATEIPRWSDLLRSGVAIFDLDFDAILAAMYDVSISAEGDCYVCVPPDPGIEATALGASESAAPSTRESATLGAGESALSGTASAQVFHTFTLDSGASRSFFRDRTTLTPLSRPVAVSLADPSGGPLLARYSTVLPCPAAPSGSLSGLYLPSFSTNLVSGADLVKRVLRYLCSTSGLGLVLGGWSPVVLTGHADASWVDDLATQRSSEGYTFSLGSGSVSWRSTRSSSVLSSSCEAVIYAGAMAAQELRWLTYLLTDLGEPPRSPPVLYVDNKAMLALCREHRLEHRTKHIALRYFLAREL